MVKSLFENQMENLIFATQFVLSKNAPIKKLYYEERKNAFGIYFGPCYMPKPCPLTFIRFLVGALPKVQNQFRNIFF